MVVLYVKMYYNCSYYFKVVIIWCLFLNIFLFKSMKIEMLFFNFKNWELDIIVFFVCGVFLFYFVYCEFKGSERG